MKSLPSSSLAKGFTLIELLIVIGILAILATLTILVLNPAQLFAQARDSQRLGDLRTLQSALAYYFSTATSPAVAAAGPFDTVGTACGFTGMVCTLNASYTTAGTGWVGVNMTGAQGGSPIAKLPQDPTNSGNYFYGYKGDTVNLTYELDTRLESTKYRTKMSSDNGDANTCVTFVEQGATPALSCYYEAGTDPGLDL